MADQRRKLDRRIRALASVSPHGRHGRLRLASSSTPTPEARWQAPGAGGPSPPPAGTEPARLLRWALARRSTLAAPRATRHLPPGAQSSAAACAHALRCCTGWSPRFAWGTPVPLPGSPPWRARSAVALPTFRWPRARRPTAPLTVGVAPLGLSMVTLIRWLRARAAAAACSCGSIHKGGFTAGCLDTLPVLRCCPRYASAAGACLPAAPGGSGARLRADLDPQRSPALG